MMKCSIFFIFIFSYIMTVKSQDINILLKEADNFEKQQNGVGALEKYKQILVLEPANLKSLVKAAELNVSLGNRQTDKSRKLFFYFPFQRLSFSQPT